MVNQQVVSRLIDDVIKSIACKREDFLLLLTDAASYMVATGKTLKELFPNLHHGICIAHLFQNCVEKVRAHFPSVGSLISSVKAVTVKNASRRFAFHDIGVSPAFSYALGILAPSGWLLQQKSSCCERIVNSFEGNGILVKNAKNAVNNDGLTEQLVMIERDYKILVELVRKADSSSYSISVASSGIASLCLASNCCGIKAI